MQSESFDGTIQKQIVTAMIVSKKALDILGPKWQDDSFADKWCNEVVSWCVEFHKKHNDAPKKAIVDLFTTWASKNKDAETQKTMERFLGSLSKNYERTSEDINPSHIAHLATDHFNRVRLERTSEDINNRLKRGDLAGAIHVAQSFAPVSASSPAYIDVFRDKEAQRHAVEKQNKVLIRYEGGIGEFFGPDLAEDALVAFLAPPKVGKSFNMLDLAWKAVEQKRKVAYFQVGDLTRDQIIRRFNRLAAGRPEQAGVALRPISLVMGADGGVAQVEHEAEVFEHNMTTQEVHHAYEKLVKSHKSQRLRLSIHPSQSICINDIKSILAEWDREGWKAKVVVIDYAENLAPNDPKMHELKQVEDTWTHMSQIRETRQCLVVSAAQASKEGYSNPWVLTRQHISRNKMILAIVSGMVGINQTEEEQSKGLFRLNWIERRNGRWSVSRCCHVASNLDCGQAVCLSAY